MFLEGNKRIQPAHLCTTAVYTSPHTPYASHSNTTGCSLPYQDTTVYNLTIFCPFVSFHFFSILGNLIHSESTREIYASVATIRGSPSEAEPNPTDPSAFVRVCKRKMTIKESVKIIDSGVFIPASHHIQSSSTHYENVHGQQS